MKKTEKGTRYVAFQPIFGNRPDQYIGRDVPHLLEYLLNEMKE